jgi:hypothetical protein
MLSFTVFYLVPRIFGLGHVEETMKLLNSSTRRFEYLKQAGNSLRRVTKVPDFGNAQIEILYVDGDEVNGRVRCKGCNIKSVERLYMPAFAKGCPAKYSIDINAHLPSGYPARLDVTVGMRSFEVRHSGSGSYFALAAAERGASSAVQIAYPESGSRYVYLPKPGKIVADFMPSPLPIYRLDIFDDGNWSGAVCVWAEGVKPELVAIDSLGMPMPGAIFKVSP